MKTNDLKKGAVVRLRNGWYARIEDNMKGNTRLATVYGYETEMGSVYSHDIECVIQPAPDKPVPGKQYLISMNKMGPFGPGLYDFINIEHTDAQKKLRRMVEGGGW